MSSAFVPGRILRAALWSRLLNNSFCCSGLADIGDSWSSGIGGGLGSRGEAGEAMVGDTSFWIRPEYTAFADFQVG
jgi:hypothetical protein